MHRDAEPITREQVAVGVRLRVIAPRWDEPIGTIGRVTETGYLLNDHTWWFAVEWLTDPQKRFRHSLRMWEKDLSTFELVTDPIVPRLPETLTKQYHATKRAPGQIVLPFTETNDD